MFTDSIGARVRHALQVAALLASLSLVVALAGCSVAKGVGGPYSSGTPGASTTPSAGPRERACDGPNGSTSDVGTIALVLSTSSPMATGTPGVVGSRPYEGNAHIGDVIQVQLPTTNQWKLSMVTGGLTLLSPSAVLDVDQSVCFWNFKAVAAGDTTLDFVGVALCAPAQACPAYARLASFSVHVS